jgi:uncharacterized protein YjbI with pentapeptide repeats
MGYMGEQNRAIRCNQGSRLGGATRALRVCLRLAAVFGLMLTWHPLAFGKTAGCEGKFKGATPTIEQLNQLLTAHVEWLRGLTLNEGVYTVDPKLFRDHRRANLCGANLREATLRGINLGLADLREANLIRADLGNARLSGADLGKAELSGAELSGAKLNGADLSMANLSGATLNGAALMMANLNSANLFAAKLRGANLGLADLRGAVLGGADLSDADLTLADLSDSVFSMAQGTLPGFELWAGTRGLSKIRMDALPKFAFAKNVEWSGRPTILSSFQQLREALKKAGMRPEERGITAAIQRAQMRGADWPERAFKYVAFDITSDYGSSSSRALEMLGAGIFFFAIPYATVLWLNKGRRRGAIWRIWQQDRLLDSAGTPPTVKPKGNEDWLISMQPTSDRERLHGLRLPKALAYGLYFSLLSAFHIGWRDLNVGNWISRMQPREYTLRPSGWVRFVSGFQSLLSVYLLALAVLTYFGRPFE